MKDLTIERNALAGKIKELEKFIGVEILASDVMKFKLAEQRYHMGCYLNILDERIAWITSGP